jgi:methionyl-tRNA formyltransferase
MKIVIIGGVNSTKLTLEKLILYNFDIIGVFGFEPEEDKYVSGYSSLKDIAISNNLPYYSFQSINDKLNVEILESLKPDIIFVIGLSQIVHNKIIDIPKLGCIGFHPTFLPEGRGRAPLAWMILDNLNYGAATFFLISKGIDDGPIFVQEKYKVDENDYSLNLQKKLSDAIRIALDKWLPDLKKGIWNPMPQEEKNATYYGKRNSLDGWINWYLSVNEIYRLIRAVSKPYPGAFSFLGDNKIIIHKAKIENSYKIKGVIGRILLVSEDNSLLIQAGDGLIWITEYQIFNYNDEEVKFIPKVGQKLGYNVENEIFKLRNSIK